MTLEADQTSTQDGSDLRPSILREDFQRAVQPLHHAGAISLKAAPTTLFCVRPGWNLLIGSYNGRQVLFLGKVNMEYVTDVLDQVDILIDDRHWYMLSLQSGCSYLYGSISNIKAFAILTFLVTYYNIEFVKQIFAVLY